MSHTSVSGFVGDSANNSFVFGLTARRHSSGSVCDTNVVSMPNFANSRPNSMMVDPNTLREQMTWSPAVSRPMPSRRMALMPLAVPMHACAPSSAASRRSNIMTVGFEKRE